MPSDRSGVVVVTVSQLANKQLPPVCAMTGEPADGWRKFRVAAFANGYVPLSRSARQTAALMLWGPIALLLAAAVYIFIAGRLHPPAGVSVAVVVVLLGAAGLGSAWLRPLVWPHFAPMQPRAGSTETLVRLSNADARFAAAVSATQVPPPPPAR